MDFGLQVTSRTCSDSNLSSEEPCQVQSCFEYCLFLVLAFLRAYMQSSETFDNTVDNIERSNGSSARAIPVYNELEGPQVIPPHLGQFWTIDL